MRIRGAAADERGRAPALSRRVTRAAAVIAAACLIALLAFVAGEHQQRQVTVLRGVAGVEGVAGDLTASVIVAGSSWVYGISGVDQWVDHLGEDHVGGWPTCLSTPERTVPITFGWVPVTAPDGSSWRQVVWVDCRS